MTNQTKVLTTWFLKAQALEVFDDQVIMQAINALRTCPYIVT
jgi:hypothetical protein